MFLTRRLDPVFQLARRTLGAAVCGFGLTLAACTPPADDAAQAPASARSESGSTAIVTAAFEPAGAIEALVFLPNDAAPWTGLVAAATSAGGFDVYTIDGERVITAAGPRLSALAAAPDFQLRGNAFPLLVGLDSMDAVRAFLVIRELGEVVEAPMAAMTLEGGIAGLCTFDVGIGYLDIAVLGREARAQIWRLRDTGDDVLSVEQRADIRLPFAARACAAASDDLLVGGPTAGLARINPEDGVAADVNSVSVTDLAYAELRGRPVVMTPSAATGALTLFDADDLDEITDLRLVDGLNAPAVSVPGAITASPESFGGMGYASGVIAVFDESDSRVKIIAREVVSRAIASES